MYYWLIYNAYSSCTLLFFWIVSNGKKKRYKTNLCTSKLNWFSVRVSPNPNLPRKRFLILSEPVSGLRELPGGWSGQLLFLLLSSALTFARLLHAVTQVSQLIRSTNHTLPSRRWVSWSTKTLNDDQHSKELTCTYKPSSYYSTDRKQHKGFLFFQSTLCLLLVFKIKAPILLLLFS